MPKKNKRSTGQAPTRNPPRIIGNGDYWTDFRSNLSRALSAAKSSIPKGTFEKVGAGIGGALGSSTIGGGAGKLVSQILGFGDYSIRSNSLVQPMNMGQTVAQFGNMSNATHICHREYIGDVVATGSTAFSSVVYSINPGQTTTFPWLSATASQYETYQFMGAIVQYKSTASDYAVGTALGSIILASEYDTADASYANKVEMENSQYCSSTKPALDAIHPLECDPSVNVSPRLYIRTGSVPDNKDVRLYDHCNVQVAQVGVPAAAGTVLGELWITYEVALFKPQIASPAAIDHFSSPLQSSTAPYFLSDSFYSPVARDGSTIGGTVLYDTYYFPPNIQSGTYMFVYTAVGSLTTITTQLNVVLTRCSAVSMFVNDAGSVVVMPESGTLAQRDVCIMKMVTITGLNANIAISVGTLPSVSTYDLWVIRMPYGLRT